jgi:hypothetical protein
MLYDTRIDTPKIIPLHLGIEPNVSEAISTRFAAGKIELYTRHWLKPAVVIGASAFAFPNSQNRASKQKAIHHKKHR